MRRIVNINPIRLARFVEADGGGGPARRGQARDRPQDSLDEIAPVGKHVEDHAAAGAGAVVPTRALTRHARAIIDPVAEIEPEANHLAEEAVIDQLADRKSKRLNSSH